MDSDAARKVIEKGVSVAMRYTRKHTGLSIALLTDMKKQVDLGRVSSEDNLSDMLTKPMPRERLLYLLQRIPFVFKDPDQNVKLKQTVMMLAQRVLEGRHG